MWAVVPSKALDAAKQRLSGLLSPGERRRLARAMLEDVLVALASAGPLAGVAVVTLDGEARALAQDFGARILADCADAGETAAVAGAARRLAAEGRRGMIAIPGDVPLVTAAEVERILSLHDSAPAATIVPAHDGRGSNAIACSPPDAMPLRFGGDSFTRHIAIARSRGIEPRVARLAGLGLDIDRPRDLAAFLARPSATRAYAYLAEVGAAERLHAIGARSAAAH